jgi:hypothetical protein
MFALIHLQNSVNRFLGLVLFSFSQIDDGRELTSPTQKQHGRMFALILFQKFVNGFLSLVVFSFSQIDDGHELGFSHLKKAWTDV